MTSEPGALVAAQPLDRHATARRSGGRHFPCLEGLRAVAASLVVVHHAAALVGEGEAGWVATPAAIGDMGVAIFFVISGLLIWRPFVVARAEDRSPQGTASFWWRRVLRIVPAYWLALSVFWAAGVIDIGGQWWRHYLLLQIYDRFSALAGIVPAWSLSTEIAFYALVPFIAWGAARLTTRLAAEHRWTVELGVPALMVMAGFVSRVLFNFAGDATRSLSFTWLPNNLDLFGLGMAVAALQVHRDSRAWLTRVAGWIGRHPGLWFGLAVGGYVAYAYLVGAPSGFDEGYRGLASWQLRQVSYGLIGLCLVLPAVFDGAGHGAGRRLLAWRPIAWAGMVSYGLYLWHLNLMERSATMLAPDFAGQPGGWNGLVFDRVATEVGFPLMLGVGLVGGLALAAVSWYGLERPLQRFRRLI